MWFNRLELGELILAPRPRYSIEKIDYKPNLNTAAASGCAGCGNGQIKDWDIVYTIHCLGHGDLKAADRIYRELAAFANAICSTDAGKKRLLRQFCDELPLEHDITAAYVNPINLDWIPECCDNTTLSLELHMTGTDINTAEDTEVIIYNYMVYAP